MEFHPLIILYITTKITQKTTNFNGMSNPIQSILPSLSTCFSRLQHHTWLPGLRQQENNGGFPPIAVSPKRPGAPVLPAHPKYKIPENWDLVFFIGVWEFDELPGARCARCPQVIHILLWITLVEFGSFSVLVG